LKKTFHVVGFGALNVDKLYRVNKIAHEDEESFIIDFMEACGGSAANTIVGLARLGLKTGFIGKVAQDREGKLLIEDFKREGVDTSMIIVTKRGRSGTVIGFVDEKGERALYVDPGVNDEISFEELNIDLIKNTEFLHLSSFVGDKSFETQKKLVEEVADEVKVSFDPGTLYVKRGLEALKPILKNSFLLLPSGEELKILTGKSIREGAKVLLRLGAEIVAVKLGKEGCYVTDGKEEHFIKAYSVKVVDTTGAGDAFNSGFLFGLVKNKDLYECGKLGNLIASKCITKMGARTGLPKLAEIQKATP